jgi:hypothetical protein
MQKQGLTSVKLMTARIAELATYMREPTSEELSQCIENYDMVIEYSKKRFKDDFKVATLQLKASTLI